MKVLFVCHSGVVSGAERALLDLLDVLPEAVSATVACPAGELQEILRAQGVDVVDLPEAAGSLRLDTRQVIGAVTGIVRSGWALNRLVRELSPDVVHANSLRAGLVVLTANTGRKAPTVVHVHDVLPRTRVADLVRQILVRRTDAVVGVSRYATERFTEGTRGARTYTFYNPINTDRYSMIGETREQARERAGLRSSGPLLGIVAQITPWKGHDVAIRALPEVLKSHPDACLLIVGAPKFAGPSVRFDNRKYLLELEQLTSDLQLDGHVQFLGEREDVPAIMRSLDVLLCPSWEEPFGRSVVEAMAVGTPVVATAVGGPSEIIRDGTDGTLLPPREMDLWSRAIISLLDDPGLRESYGRRASESVRARFDRRSYADRVVAMYEELTAGHIAKPGSSASSRRPLRILFLEHGAEMGGAQHSLMELMRALSGQHTVALACPEGPLATEIRKLGVEVLVVPPSQLTFRLGSPVAVLEASRSILARRAMRAAVRSWRPDVVHANTLRAGLLAPRTRTAPLVVHCRDLLPSGSVAALVKRTIVRRSSAVVAVSRTVAARLTGRRSSPTPVFVVDNPVDTARFDPDAVDRPSARKALGITGEPVIAVIAQITPWKGQLRAVRILAELQRPHPDARLLLAGETKFIGRATSYDNQAYERELKSTIAELGLERSVDWLGERKDVETVLACTDVLLVPSTEEPFGRTVIEALAMNIPVIATNAGGPAEVIRPGLDGYTLPPDDLGAWVTAITRVLTETTESSRSYAIERFSTERHAEQILSVYHEVLSAAVPVHSRRRLGASSN